MPASCITLCPGAGKQNSSTSHNLPHVRSHASQMQPQHKQHHAHPVAAGGTVRVRLEASSTSCQDISSKQPIAQVFVQRRHWPDGAAPATAAGQETHKDPPHCTACLAAGVPPPRPFPTAHSCERSLTQKLRKKAQTCAAKLKVSVTPAQQHRQLAHRGQHCCSHWALWLTGPWREPVAAAQIAAVTAAANASLKLQAQICFASCRCTQQHHINLQLAREASQGTHKLLSCMSGHWLVLSNPADKTQRPTQSSHNNERQHSPTHTHQTIPHTHRKDTRYKP
jgi:hypothetical protein